MIVSSFSHHPTLEMAHSNVIIQGGVFSSGQGDVHIHNRDSESGMQKFRSVQKNC